MVITGIKPVGNSSSFIYNLAVTDNGSFKQRSHFFDRSFSGTGDLFASVLCGCRINGRSTEDAIGLASSFIYHSIADTVNDVEKNNAGTLQEVMSSGNYDMEVPMELIHASEQFPEFIRIAFNFNHAFVQRRL